MCNHQINNRLYLSFHFQDKINLTIRPLFVLDSGNKLKFIRFNNSFTNLMTKPIKGWILHILLASSYLGLIYIYYPTQFLFGPLAYTNPHEISIIASYVLLYFIFYLNYYRLAPLFFLTQKYITYFLLVIVLFWAIYLITHHVQWNHFFTSIGAPPQPPDLSPEGLLPPEGNMENSKPNFLNELTRVLLLFLIGIFFTLLLRLKQHAEELNKSNLESTIQYLHARINPHFVFNSLNGIMAISLSENASKTASAVTILSEIMHYHIQDITGNSVSLEGEVRNIKNYISMQQLRFGDTMDLEFILSENHDEDTCIVPSLLMPFIENAFKYGINPEEKSLIKIRINTLSKKISMLVENRVMPFAVQNQSTQIGITTTKERLYLFYPGRHSLDVVEKNNVFSILLNIDLA